MDEAKPKRTFKDSVFRSRFSNPTDLSAIHTRITGIPTKPEDITINTLKHVFFSLERNDLSYLVNHRFVVLFEEQSTLNQNMPLRMLVYITMLYRKMLKRRDFSLPAVFLFRRRNSTNSTAAPRTSPLPPPCAFRIPFRRIFLFHRLWN